MNRARTNPGYLLVELLGAIILIAIAAAVIVPGVVIRSEPSAVNRACAQIADLDRRARIASIADGPVVMALDAEANVLSLTNAHERITAAPIERSVFILDRDDRPIQRVEFDRLGRSADYTVQIRSDSDRTSVLHIDGFTGHMHREDDPDG